MRDVLNLLGLPVDICCMDQAVARVMDSARTKKPLFISTPNANFLVQSFKDPLFRQSVIASDLSLLDGMPLVLLSRLLGAKEAQRVAGSDLFNALDRHCIQNAGTLRVFFFGGRDGAAAAAHARYQDAQTGIQSAGFYNPGFGSVADMSSNEIRQRINDSGADFVVVALGAKKGQAWIMQNRASLEPPVICHLGAVIDFAAGTVDKAPKWVSRAGLEWAWRIGQEPSLWRRYFFDAFALARAVFGRAIALSRMKPPQTATAPSFELQTGTDHACRMTLHGSFLRSDAPLIAQAFASVPQDSEILSIDLKDTQYLGPFAQGTLLLQAYTFLKQNKSLKVINPNRDVARSIKRNKLLDSLSCIKTTKSRF